MVHNLQLYIEEHAVDIIKEVKSNSLIVNVAYDETKEMVNRYMLCIFLFSYIIPTNEEENAFCEILALKIIDIVTSKRYIGLSKEEFFDSGSSSEKKCLEECNKNTPGGFMYNISLFYLKMSGLDEPGIKDILLTSTKIATLIEKNKQVFANKSNDPYLHDQKSRKKEEIIWFVVILIILIFVFKSCNH